MVEEIRAMLVYEILGRPPEHIQKALENFIDSLSEKKGLRLINKKISEPKLLDKEESDSSAQEVYTTFAEIELGIENMGLLFGLILNTMPANIEILEPSSLNLNNFDLSGVLNELTMKLHKYDEVTKVVTMERDNLAREINELKSGGSEPKLGGLTTNVKPSSEVVKEESVDEKEDVREEKSEENSDSEKKD